MKRTVLFLLIAFITSKGYAQQVVGSWSIQPKVGLNIATITNDETAKVRLAFAGGLDIGYMVSNKFLFSIGAMYSQQGCDAESNGIDGTLKMDYINVPIMANYYVVEGLAFKIGFQPGFLINDKIKVSSNGASAEVGIEQALRAAGIDASVNSFDLAIPLGLSYEFNNIQLDARYNLGLTKLFTGKGIDTSRNSVFQFTIGYKIGL